MSTRLNPTYRMTTVPPGMMFVSENPQDAFKTVQLASSIAILAICRKPLLAGIIHILMPESHIVSSIDNPLKFGDTGIPMFLQELRRRELDFSRTAFLLVGGSQLFNFGGETSNMLNVGMRNIIMAQSILSQAGCKLSVKDTGGNRPRTLNVTVATGQVQVQIPGYPAVKLFG